MNPSDLAIIAMAVNSLATLGLGYAVVRRLPLDRVQVPAAPRPRPEPKTEQPAQAEVEQIDGRRAS